MAKKNNLKGIEVASMMASRWDDEYLMGKTPDELSEAYGILIKDARSILNTEKFRRKIKG